MNINDLVAENVAAHAAAAAENAEGINDAASIELNGLGSIAGGMENVENLKEGLANFQKEIADLKAAIEKMADAAAQKDDQILRQKAEFQNFRRRTLQEKTALSQVVTENLIKSLLPTLDNLERAAYSENGDCDALKKGVDLILREFCKILTDNGLAPIEAVGKEFDPNFHQAVMRVQNPELADNTIAAELQRGYTVNGSVIRPSMVQVVAN